jgi:hypothetical protein
MPIFALRGSTSRGRSAPRSHPALRVAKSGRPETAAIVSSSSPAALAASVRPRCARRGRDPDVCREDRRAEKADPLSRFWARSSRVRASSVVSATLRPSSPGWRAEDLKGGARREGNLWVPATWVSGDGRTWSAAATPEVNGSASSYLVADSLAAGPHGLLATIGVARSPGKLQRGATLPRVGHQIHGARTRMRALGSPPSRRTAGGGRRRAGDQGLT